MKNNSLVGEIFTSTNFGDVVVIEYADYYNVVIKFLSTGTVSNARLDSIRDGGVVDYNSPAVYGFGFRGYGAHKAKSKAYTSWSAMIRRCYSQEWLERFPSYTGCRVCENWRNFQTFADWFYENLSEDLIGKRVEVDKDIIGNRKIYSPSTCVLVEPKDNMAESNDRNLGKEYTLINPEGDVVNIRNMNKFCRENNLDKSGMINVVNGKYKQHKGWTAPIADKTNYRKGVK
ncbi:hypothetical protein NVP1223O_26 [Vibrio phage 1.223.O._10N.261.48.A9]|nr:hypothetical protein NVP1223O_26 [Vibrio phage 1.223.O._10N.261.48.A9]